MAGLSEANGIGDAPRPRPSTRETDPGAVVGGSSRGEEAQESTGAAVSPWPGSRSKRERTPEGSKASKRACRLLTGEIGEVGTGGQTGRAHVRQRGRPSDRGKPSSRLLRLDPRTRVARQRAVADGESERETLHLDRAGGGRIRIRKGATRGPRERVRLLGKGRLLRAAPVGRERHGTRPRSVGAPR